MILPALLAIFPLASRAVELSSPVTSLGHHGSRTYSLDLNTVGKDFFNDFTFQTFDDPTHGRVNYVNATYAAANKLAYATKGNKQFVMKADSTRKVTAGQRGRDSIRIASKKTYTDSVYILDIVHMPVGCATWPAWWTVSRSMWPTGGEIDIIEGVNNQAMNLASLHTSSNCTQPATGRNQTGTPGSLDCDAAVNYNSGCGSFFTKPKTYGTTLNQGGGGWFAMRRNNDQGVSVWFWARDEPNVPADVRNGAKKVNPDKWGVPGATFITNTCDFDSHFDAHEIIFDLTLCGDWADAVYANDGCPGSCVDFVDNNPGAFTEAYWLLNGLRVYV